MKAQFKAQWDRFKWRCIWSWEGWVNCWQEEQSLKQWLVANAISAPLALWLPLSGGERAAILALGVLVLAAELFNTAIERCVDLITQEKHDLAKQAKDLGSAGVAVTALAAGVAWAVVLIRLYA
ncbi:diacylglycerol kinase [Halocynthiibacter namhaensis]|uniref:diacylglycerol kinase n=1 Tax=Halocynthiibacter namhaensis TaxID=1290553 RepID=UPI000579341C|nr:diacylglycerol kinase [Halocynthiibacter namhaensis]